MTLLLSALLLLCCVALVWQGILIRAQRRDIGDLTRRVEELSRPDSWRALKGKAV